ncbi:probable mitogen-activated protein kinase kinase kinase 9 at C-terminar half [Coccomyxa sp. Obi]|nr:probable mitogen-activated protein kinase kinase kinase 9 at C-terminar half [Coccomyxa sp. Obi]
MKHDMLLSVSSQSCNDLGLPGRGASGSIELPRTGRIGCPGAPNLTLGRLIGRGSFGRVYKGEWQGQEVAVKVLCSQGSQEANFESLSEYFVSKQVRHPNVVQTYKVIVGQPSVSQQCSRLESQPSPSESASTFGAAFSRVLPAAKSHSSLDGVVQFFQDCGRDSSSVPALATGARQLAAEMAPDACHLAADMAAKDCHLADDVMAQSAEVSAFAAAAAVPATPEAVAASSLDCHGGDGSEDGQLQAILDSTGTFGGSRAATLPLAPSPFEAAMERALSGNAGAASDPLLQRIARSFSASDETAATAAAARRTAASRPAAAAKRAPPGPLCGVSSLGTLTADMQRSWLAMGSSIGSNRGAFPATRSLHARPSAPGLPPPLPPRPAGSHSMVATGAALVMEYADLGSLHTAISGGRIEGNLDAVLLCARDVAVGMAYLHSMDIIHSDLKPANVLLKSAEATLSDARGFTCKARIADFGMARRIAAGRNYICIDMPGSLQYTAPEALQAGKMTKSSDVYSFAILLLELWSGCASYTDQNYYGVLYSVVCGCRPSVPADAPGGYRALLEACWADDPGMRPTFTAIVDQITALLLAVPDNQSK